VPKATLVAPDGTVYTGSANPDAYVGFSSADVNLISSTDCGASWSQPSTIVSDINVPTYRNTTFREGIVDAFAVGTQLVHGHYPLYLAWEDGASGVSNIWLKASFDGGASWSDPILVNDNATPVDELQPNLTVDAASGKVAVAFYDRRATCPNDASILPGHRGDANTCIDISLQAYKDNGAATGAQPVGGNVRVSQFTWDPDQPQQKVGGLTQYPCAGHTDPCPPGRGFIGDYFGLAISDGNVYTLSASTHYPATGVRADGGGPIYYQQQVLATVPRSGFGTSY